MKQLLGGIQVENDVFLNDILYYTVRAPAAK